MISLTAEEAGGALGLAPLGGPVLGVSIDSRTTRPGDLFVALRGERVDGHDYLDHAFAAGAGGAVVAADSAPGRLTAAGGSGRASLGVSPGAPVYVVPDTLAALGLLARAVRRRSRAVVIAVTGSVGKTTTKDLLVAMAAEGNRVVGTRANHNNEVGLPLTLLELRDDTQVAVVEMGMRGVGQIAQLTAIAEPDVGLITNVEPVHLELLGTLGAIARAKAELLHGLRGGGVAVIPAGVESLDEAVRALPVRVVRFGLVGEPAEVDARLARAGERGARPVLGSGDVPPPTVDVLGYLGSGPEGAPAVRLWWPGGRAEVSPPFTAHHRLRNVVAATATCYAAGLDVTSCLAGLQEVRFNPHRGDETTIDGVCIIDDTYNANPPAVRVALDALVDAARARGGRAVAVLGDMLELGPEAASYHTEVGVRAAQVGVEVLWGVGACSRATVEGYSRVAASRDAAEPRWFSDAEAEAIVPGLAELVRDLKPGDVVLLKASRGMRLERVVEALQDALQRRMG